MQDNLLNRILRDLEFDRDDLDVAWKTQARKLMEYGYLSAKTEREVSDLKRELERIEAKLYGIYRTTLSLDGARINEATIESKVRNDPSYLTARANYDKAKERADILKHAVNAFSHRRDMIVQASKMQLTELERMGAEKFHNSR